MRFLEVLATVNALPYYDRVASYALGRLRLHVAPVTIVETVR